MHRSSLRSIDSSTRTRRPAGRSRTARSVGAVLLGLGVLLAVTGVAGGAAGAGAEASCDAGGSGRITNGSFETPAIGSSPTYRIFTAAGSGAVWSTTATDGKMEYWTNGYQGVPAFAGTQFAELNANLPSALSQDVTTVPGETYNWRLAHRGRGGVDTMALRIGAPGATVEIQQMSDGKDAWGVHEGTYTVPAGQTTTRFEFAAVRTASGSLSIGNFLDGIEFTPCALPPVPTTTTTTTTTTRRRRHDVHDGADDDRAHDHLDDDPHHHDVQHHDGADTTSSTTSTTVAPAPTTVPDTTVPEATSTTEADGGQVGDGAEITQAGEVASASLQNTTSGSSGGSTAGSSVGSTSGGSSPQSLAFTGGRSFVLVALGAAALVLGLLARGIGRRV